MMGKFIGNSYIDGKNRGFHFRLRFSLHPHHPHVLPRWARSQKAIRWLLGAMFDGWNKRWTHEVAMENDVLAIENGVLLGNTPHV